MKNKLLIFGIVLLVVFQSFFILSQEDELINICEGEYGIGCGENLALSGSNFEVSEEGMITFGEKGGKLIFNQGEENEVIIEGTGVEISPTGDIKIINEDSNFIINDNKFENIKASGIDERGIKIDASIILDKKTGTISKCKFWTNENGGSYIINGLEFDADGNSMIQCNSKENLLTLNAKGRNWREEGRGNINIKSIKKPIKLSGDNIKLFEGYILNEGVLDFDGKGNIFVSGGNKADINGVEIDAENKGYNEKIKLFFDGQEHEESHSISFGKDSIKYNRLKGEDSPILKFKQGNDYIKIEEGDYVDMFGDSFVLENRNLEGLIPKISISSGDTFFMQNGGKSIILKEKNIFLEDGRSHALEKSTTSPIEIIYGNFGNEKKIFVDNFNRFALVPRGVDTEYITESEGMDTKFSLKLKYNYLNEDIFEKITGKKIIFSKNTPEGFKQLFNGRMKDYLKDLTPEMREAIDIISFNESGMGVIGNAQYFPSSKSIAFYKFSSIQKSTFLHEVAHARHYFIRGENTNEIREKEKELQSSLGNSLSPFTSIVYLSNKDAKKYLKSKNLSPYEISRLEKNRKEYLKMKRQFFNTFKNKKFDKEWYGLWKKYEDKIFLFSYKNKLEKQESSLYGFVRGYGGTNHREDVATYLGKIDDPSFFKPLLSKDNEWHKIYRKKLDLLYEYKFISKSEYNKILEVAGAK